MSTHRAGENGAIPERTGRLLKQEGYWYYTTREGVDIGPFDTKEDAEIGVGEFIDFVCGADPAAVRALANYRMV